MILIFFRCAVYGMILVEELDVQMIPMSPEFMWLPFVLFVPKVASQMAKNQLLDIR
jgi:nitrate reductase beta subunit